MNDKVNVLLVDDQPAKLLANEEILRDLGENLVKASSAREALEFLLKNDAAVVLIDVCMPELDGFQLAAMIRDHPRFQRRRLFLSPPSRWTMSTGCAVTRWVRSTMCRCRSFRRCCEPRSRCSPNSIVRRVSSNDLITSWSDGSPSARRSSRPQPRVCRQRTAIAVGDRGRRNRPLGRRQRDRYAVLAAAR